MDSAPCESLSPSLRSGSCYVIVLFVLHPSLEPVSTSCSLSSFLCSSTGVTRHSPSPLVSVCCASVMFVVANDPLAHSSPTPHVLCLFLCRIHPCTLTDIHTTYRTSFVSMCHIPPTLFPVHALSLSPPRLSPLLVSLGSYLHLSILCTSFLFLLSLYIPDIPSRRSPRSCSITSKARAVFSSPDFTSTIINLPSIDFFRVII